MYWISLFHRLSHFFYHKRAVNHTKKYTMTFLLIQETKKAFYLSILNFVSLVSVLGQKNHKNLLKKEFNSLLLNFVITKLK